MCNALSLLRFSNLRQTAVCFASYPVGSSDSAYEVSSTVAESTIAFVRESSTRLEKFDIQNGVFPNHSLLKILPSLKRLCMSLSLDDLRALTPSDAEHRGSDQQLAICPGDDAVRTFFLITSYTDVSFINGRKEIENPSESRHAHIQWHFQYA